LQSGWNYGPIWKPKTPARAAESQGAVSFGAVPLAALARFASALAKVKLP